MRDKLIARLQREFGASNDDGQDSRWILEHLGVAEPLTLHVTGGDDSQPLTMTLCNRHQDSPSNLAFYPRTDGEIDQALIQIRSRLAKAFPAAPEPGAISGSKSIRTSATHRSLSRD